MTEEATWLAIWQWVLHDTSIYCCPVCGTLVGWCMNPDHQSRWVHVAGHALDGYVGKTAGAW